MILENTFTSLPQLVDEIMPAVAFLKSFVLRNYWPSISRIPHVTAPILFIAGKKDELVPHYHMIALMGAATGARFKDWFEVENGEHNTTWMVAGDSYQLRVRQFIDRCLGA